jgi:hypothetical protein
MTRLCACGCGTPVRREFVLGHNRRGAELPKIAPVDRVLARTTQEDRGYSSPCWCWQGSLNQRGYGHIGLLTNGRRSCAKVHRIVFEALVGPIPEGLTLDHLCEVKTCVNPAHLEPTTRLENQLRYYARRKQIPEVSKFSPRSGDYT